VWVGPGIAPSSTVPKRSAENSTAHRFLHHFEECNGYVTGKQHIDTFSEVNQNDIFIGRKFVVSDPRPNSMADFCDCGN
jgi:hypothetical protein